jgi:hypothetical protein
MQIRAGPERRVVGKAERAGGGRVVPPNTYRRPTAGVRLPSVRPPVPVIVQGGRGQNSIAASRFKLGHERH